MKKLAVTILRKNAIVTNVDNMKWLGFGATNLSHATKLTGSKLAKKSDNTQLFYIMCYMAFLLCIQNLTKKNVPKCIIIMCRLAWNQMEIELIAIQITGKL